jgi:chorismate-pyruvate lyase
MNPSTAKTSSGIFTGYGYNPVHGFYPETRTDHGKPFGLDFNQIPPILRTLLVSDGTVTKFLEAYYWEPIQVKRLFHGDSEIDRDLAPIELKRGDTALHRRVLLCGMATQRVYSYAESFIRTDLLWPNVRDDLVQGRLGIGELLRDKRVETYRELLTYEMGRAGPIAQELGCAEDAPLISRTYRILIGGKPCLFIDERFPVHHFA